MGTEPLHWQPCNALKNPFPLYRRLRDEAPVYLTPNGDYYALSRFDDVSAGLINSKVFRSQTAAFPGPLDLPLIQTDPPRHAMLRSTVAQPFLPREVTKLEPMIREIVARRLDELAELGDGELVESFSQHIPMDVIGHMLGVPDADRPRVRALAETYELCGVNRLNPEPRAVDGLKKLTDFFVEARKAGRRTPGENIMATLDEDESLGRRLSDFEFARLCSLIAITGTISTTQLMSYALLELGRHPDAREMVKSDASLIPGAICEVGRFRTIAPFAGRMTAADIELHGVTIPRGSGVLFLLDSALRDERRFDNPETFDITRTGGDTLVFGRGRHSCLGKPLAQLEIAIVVEEFLKRFPNYEFDEDSLEIPRHSMTAGYRTMNIRLNA